MNRDDFEKNKKALSLCDIVVHCPAYPEMEFSAELECYTPAGEDMIICLEELSAQCLEEYIDDFDINEKVCLWWPNGHKMEGMGVPFDNIKEHFEDYEQWLDELRLVVKDLA